MIKKKRQKNGEVGEKDKTTTLNPQNIPEVDNRQVQMDFGQEGQMMVSSAVTGIVRAII